MPAEKLTFQAVLRWDEEQCRDFLVAMRWPDGIRCPKCGSTDEPYIIRRKNKGGSERNKVKTIYNCRSCRRQFTATVGTIFEDSKIPLSKWLAAIFLMCSSKKGISAHQLYRMLDLGSSGRLVYGPPYPGSNAGEGIAGTPDRGCGSG